MADGGGINLRLSLRGAEQVKAELASIGPAGSRMAQQLDRAMRTPGPGIQALDAGMKNARGGVEGLTSRLGPLGAGLGAVGGVGLAVAASLAAVAAGVAMALNQARAAAQWADEIEDSAAKINIGTTALQEWRFAAAEAGASAQDADRAIDGFQKKLGDAMAGGRSAKWFERLGFSREDLRAFEGTEDALDAVINRIAGLGTEAERAAVADKLGLGPLIPLVREGSDAIAGMRQEAHDLGLVMEEEMIKRGAETARQMEELSEKIDGQLRQAFLDLGPALLWVMGIVGQLAAALNDLSNAWRAFDDKSSDYLRREDQRLAQGITSLLARAKAEHGADTPDDLRPSERTLFDRMNARRGRIAAELGERSAARAAEPAPAPVPAVILQDVSGGGGRSRRDGDADRRKREGERALEQLQREELDAERALLQARFGPGGTEENRTELDLALNSLRIEKQNAEREELRATLEAAGLLDETNIERLAALKDAQDAAAKLEDAAILRDEELRLADMRRQIEDRHLELTTNILAIASAEARTSEERREIELRILEIAQRRERAELEAAIAAEKDAAVRAGLIEDLQRLPELHAAQRGQVLRNTAGPVERWRDSQPQSPAELRELIESSTLDALDGVNRGLRDAWKNAESAGDAFDRMGQVAVDALGQIVDALLEVAIQRMLIEPMVNAVFGTPGGGGSGGGGWFGQAMGVFSSVFGGGGGGIGYGIGGIGGGMLPTSQTGLKAGKAWGGVVGSSGLYPVGERGIELAELPVGTRIHDTERTAQIMAGLDRAMRAPGVAGGGSGGVSVTLINKGEPMKASASEGPAGQPVITLEPARQMVRGVVREMGTDGSLVGSLGLTPQPRRRG